MKLAIRAGATLSTQILKSLLCITLFACNACSSIHIHLAFHYLPSLLQLSTHIYCSNQAAQLWCRGDISQTYATSSGCFWSEFPCIFTVILIPWIQLENLQHFHTSTWLRSDTNTTDMSRIHEVSISIFPHGFISILIPWIQAPFVKS